MRKNCNRGQSTVEFALIFPVLLLLLLGIVEFSLAFNAQITLTNAAKEGARYGAINNRTNQEVLQYVKNSAVGLDSKKISWVETNPKIYDNKKIIVHVKYSFDILDPIMQGIVGKSINIKARVVMSLE